MSQNQSDRSSTEEFKHADRSKSVSICLALLLMLTTGCSMNVSMNKANPASSTPDEQTPPEVPRPGSEMKGGDFVMHASITFVEGATSVASASGTQIVLEKPNASTSVEKEAEVTNE